MIASDTFSVTRDAQAIDDCWNRIGIHGDKSCPLLSEHIHCRNCAVYSAAATRLLDRYALQQEDRGTSVRRGRERGENPLAVDVPSG